MTATPHRTGLVLSGGGARGAYEAGVIAGLAEVLAELGMPHPPVDVLSGTSVGAINAAYCVGNAHLPQWNVQGLLSYWRDLDIHEYLDVNVTSLARLLRGISRDEESLGWSILKIDPIEKMVHRGIPWRDVHQNVAQGRIHAFIVPALRVADGVTTVFIERSGQLDYAPSRDPRRKAEFEPIHPEHVLASAAFPFLFPARRVGKDYFCDGGLRFNTPIAPAIRCGCDKLVVVSLLSQVRAAQAQRVTEAAFPSPVFLVGKLINALLLDPVHHDLRVLAHTNDLVDVLERSVDEATLEQIREVHRASRGVPYRRVRTLAFAPSRNVAHMASEHAQTLRVKKLSSWLLGRMSSLGTTWEADLLSFVMFDGSFTRQLAELGYSDARDKREEIQRFFEA